MQTRTVWWWWWDILVSLHVDYCGGSPTVSITAPPSSCCLLDEYFNIIFHFLQQFSPYLHSNLVIFLQMIEIWTDTWSPRTWRERGPSTRPTRATPACGLEDGQRLLQISRRKRPKEVLIQSPSFLLILQLNIQVLQVTPISLRT